MHVVIVAICGAWVAAYAVWQLRDTKRDANTPAMHTAYLFKIESTETGKVVAFDIYSNASPAAHGPHRYRPDAVCPSASGETLEAAENALVKSILKDIQDASTCPWPPSERVLLLQMVEQRQQDRTFAKPRARIVKSSPGLDPLAPVLLLAEVRSMMVEGGGSRDLGDRIDAELGRWPRPHRAVGCMFFYPPPHQELRDVGHVGSYRRSATESWPVHVVVAVGPLGVALLHADDRTLRLLEHEQWPLETPPARGVWEFVGHATSDFEFSGKWAHVCDGLAEAFKRRQS